MVDALEEVKIPAEKQFRAVLVDAPAIELVVQLQSKAPRVRLPRKIDFASRDEANRQLGRAGEQWVLGYEQQRLQDAGQAELFQRLDWVSDRLGDGAGYDILSYDATDRPRYIEVKTTNGAHKSAFIISRNELEFAQESGDAFHLYRVFQFRRDANALHAARRCFNAVAPRANRLPRIISENRSMTDSTTTTINSKEMLFPFVLFLLPYLSKKTNALP